MHLPRPPGVAPLHARRLAARFRQDAIGLVHCHNITALFHGARAARAAGRLPVLYTEHDRDLPFVERVRRIIGRPPAGGETRGFKVLEGMRQPRMSPAQAGQAVGPQCDR